MILYRCTISTHPTTLHDDVAAVPRHPMAHTTSTLHTMTWQQLLVDLILFTSSCSFLLICCSYCSFLRIDPHFFGLEHMHNLQWEFNRCCMSDITVKILCKK